MSKIVNEEIQRVLTTSSWSKDRQVNLFQYQDSIQEDDPRVRVFGNLNGLTVKFRSDRKLEFFRPEGAHPILSEMRTEDIIARALKEAQDFESVYINDPVFLAYLEVSPSPLCIYVDKHCQYFAVGEGLYYLGNCINEALETIILDWSKASYVNSDGSLVDQHEKAVSGHVQLLNVDSAT